MLVWHIIVVVPDEPRLLVTTSHVMPSHTNSEPDPWDVSKYDASRCLISTCVLGLDISEYPMIVSCHIYRRPSKPVRKRDQNLPADPIKVLDM